MVDAKPAMRRRFVALAAVAVMTALAIILPGGSALANSSAFTWAMRFRYVSGKDNKKSHSLDAGELTVSGKIWIFEKNAKATSSPGAITIEVWKDGTLSDDRVCALTVVPDTTLNSKKEISRSCGRVESGSSGSKSTRTTPRAVTGTAGTTRARER